MRRERVIAGLGIVGVLIIALLAGISFGQQGGAPVVPALRPCRAPTGQ